MLDNYEYNDENIRSLVDSHYQNYINLFFNCINYYNKMEIYRKNTKRAMSDTHNSDWLPSELFQ